MASVGGTARREAQRSYGEGGAGEIQVLQIEDLKFDHLYQRDLIADMVEKITNEYDIVTAGTIVVSKRPSGELYVVDGQHRVAGAKQRGETEILAQVIEGLTPQEEADLRIKGNFKRNDSTFEVFRARIFAGDEIALGMQATLNDFGSKLNYMPDINAGVNSIAAVEKIYRLDNGVHLRRVLTVLELAWGLPVGGRNVTSDILKAVSWFLQRHEGEMDRSRLVEKIQMHGPAALGRLARNYRAAQGGTGWVNTYRALVDSYNQGLRSESNMLEWRTSRSAKFGRSSNTDAGAD